MFTKSIPIFITDWCQIKGKPLQGRHLVALLHFVDMVLFEGRVTVHQYKVVLNDRLHLR